MESVTGLIHLKKIAYVSGIKTGTIWLVIKYAVNQPSEADKSFFFLFYGTITH